MRYSSRESSKSQRPPLSRSTRLTLICRGRTTAGTAATFAGDASLADGEAERIAALRARMPAIASLSSAPETATRQTAALLADGFAIDPDFRDLDLARWAGEAVESVGAREPEALALWRSDPEAAPHGGESIALLVERLWLAANLRKSGHHTIVTHPAVIRAAVLAVLDAPAAGFWSIDVEPLALADLRSDGRRWALRGLGHMR